MAEETILINLEVDAEASVESINTLTKANKALREERNKLNLQSDQGKKRAVEINSLLDQNTEKIRTNVSALEKQKINIGNYKSALDGVVPGLGNMAQGLDKGTSGFKAMTAQALKFIATPLGAILAAIVTVFTLLKSAISTNNAVLDKFENITNAVGVVLTVIINRVGKLGEALIALASGNFTEAINLTGQAFGGLADEIGAALAQGQLYLDLSRQLEDSQRSLRIEIAKQENEIKRLVVAAKNRSLSFTEQEELLKRALKLEELLVKKRVENAQKDLVITAKKIALDKAVSQTSEETFDEFVNRLVKSEKLQDEQVDEIVSKIEALEQARGSSLAFQEKLENSLAAIQEKRTAAIEKQNKALEEQQAINDANRRASSADPTRPTEDPLIGAFETRAKVITDIDKRMNDDLVKRNKAADDQIVQHKIKAAELEKEIERAKLAFTADVLGSIGSLVEQDSREGKIIASAQALINTYLAATAALASGSELNPIFGILSAAAAIASGLASVAKINEIQFAEGGWTGPGNKWDPVGVVHADEYVTPKHIVNSPAAQPHIQALESMRLRPYADGGFVTNQNTSQAQQSLLMINAIKHLPQPVLGVEEVTRVQKRISVRDNVARIGGRSVR